MGSKGEFIFKSLYVNEFCRQRDSLHNFIMNVCDEENYKGFSLMDDYNYVIKIYYHYVFSGLDEFYDIIPLLKDVEKNKGFKGLKEFIKLNKEALIQSIIEINKEYFKCGYEEKARAIKEGEWY